jgi:hypothetical protein
LKFDDGHVNDDIFGDAGDADVLKWDILWQRAHMHDETR